MRSKLDNLKQQAMASLLFRDESLDAFHVSVGRFVLAFSVLEGSVQLALWTAASVSTPIARAIFSGVKTDQASSLITRIAAVKRWPSRKKTEFQAISTHMGEINQLRNDLLHFGAKATGKPGTWRISNDFFALLKSRLRTHTISATTLNNATQDLYLISTRLAVLCWGDQMPRRLRTMLGKSKGMPWRYTPPAQSRRRRKNRSGPARRRSPPQASPA